MSMQNGAFGHIARELFTLQQRMDHLEEENRTLRRLLAELRAGRGIQVQIADTRFVLRDGLASHDLLTPPR